MANASRVTVKMNLSVVNLAPKDTIPRLVLSAKFLKATVRTTLFPKGPWQ